jgi:hypothetical protein
MNWSAMAFGAGLSFGATMASLEATDSNPAAGVMAGLGVAGVFSFLFALCFYLVGKHESNRHRTSTAMITEDMDDVARRAGRTDVIPPPPKPQPRRWQRLRRQGQE